MHYELLPTQAPSVVCTRVIDVVTGGLQGIVVGGPRADI